MAVRFEDCVLDPDRQELRRADVAVDIEPRALRVLIELVEHQGRVRTKEELLDTVWGDRFVSESALTSQIKAIRRAVGDTGTAQRVIKTVHGRGYMFVAEVEEDVATEHVKATRSNPLLAVVPFETLGDDPARAHIGGGLAHDVITALAKHRWLRVVPRGTATMFAAEPDAASRLRDELGVDYVVEGTVRTSADRLRVNVSLTDAVGDVCLWAERYDRRIEDLFEVLDEITGVLVATIEPEVGAAERAKVRDRSRTDLAAWDLFHLGLAHFFRFTAEDNLEAQHLLARCRELDPDFGDAHAWWAYAVVLGMTYWETEADPATLEEALEATRLALDLDDRNAVYYMLRGRVQLARREYASALVDNERAVELNPTFAAAYCGLGDSLSYEGRYDDAVEHFTHAVAIGTHDPQRWAFLSYGALALIFAGRFEEALDWTERASSIPNRQYWTIAHKVVALARLGREDEAAAAVRQLREECPEFSIEYARRKLFYLKRREQLDCYLGGLAAAGVPET